jgi:amidase
VLVIDTHPLCPTASSIATALNGLAERLAKLGCQVVRESPKLPNLAQTTRIYFKLLAAFFAAEPEVRARVEAAANSLSADDQSLEAADLRCLTMNHVDWVHKSRIGSGLRARWQALFEEVDVAMWPPTPVLAFPHDHAPQRTRQLDIDDKKVPYGDQKAWIGIATRTGLPATVAPIGRSESCLPIGVQIIGGYLDARRTIALAGMIEREFGGFVALPLD